MRLSLWQSAFIVLLAAGYTLAKTTRSPGTTPSKSHTTSTHGTPTTPVKPPRTPSSPHGTPTKASRTPTKTPGKSTTTPRTPATTPGKPTTRGKITGTLPTTRKPGTSATTSGTSATATASLEPPIPGVYPVATPNYLPSVDQPALVPDFEPAWRDAYTLATAKVVGFTLEQKVSIATGLGYHGGRCNGNIGIVDSFPGLCIEGSSLGVRDADFVTAFPAPINAAATWQRGLLRARGAAMGAEHAGKGVNIALSPMMNLGRVAQGGRNWEGFGADPFLASVSAYETILGLQSSGVQAAAGHFINYEQETNRDSYSSNVDDRTQHEIYAAPFLRSVMAGVASVMCSYNLVNGLYACENNSTLNSLLKSEFGFKGFVMSDWYATHSTTSALYGLDMTMPGDITQASGTTYFGANLVAAVKNGTIPEARVDDMATRILASWFFVGQTNFTQPNFNANEPLDAATNQHVNVQADHGTLVRKIAAASMILLKNADNTLPLKKPRRLVLIGSDAAPAHIAGPNGFTDQGGVDGVLAMGWGSGTAQFTYLISPYEALQARARNDHTSFSWFFDDFDTVGASNAAYYQDAAIVFLQADSGEGTITVDGNAGDRKNLTAWHNGDALVQAVAAKNSNTIVVVHSVGPISLEAWADNPNVKAIIWAGLGGTETGNALVDVLYGDVNPSGRLPYTIAELPGDYPQLATGTDNTYSEGLFIDYRHFDAANIHPRYEFGFGLSYTTFAYSDLSITAVTGQPDQDGSQEANWAASKPYPQAVGSSTALWLHRPLLDVTFNVKNTGGVAGTEIPQVYVQFPANSGEPPSVLRGFTDVALQPGQTQTVTISLSRYDLSIWDVPTQSWMRAAGTYNITVGASSRDFRLSNQSPL
ncbi:beta-glucosidase [Lactarius akahatsu]|uniref:beta-glucosidase n=1 Tax=Lactarius akahatsu TaxID=416441 RepID=A0AAD4Q571_9AGAM|nr:beta-glucosidase [Lactarius akahatsu]